MRTPARTLRHPSELVRAGLVPPERLSALERVAARYAVAISPALAELIDPSDPQDPIARQFVPDPAELDVAAEERSDPIGDDAMSPVPGIVHRYPDRVLLKLVHVCPVYCRFCFRREMVGPHGRPALTPAELAAALAYIQGRREIWEVILTGGDPLMMAPRRLGALVEALDAMAHIAVIRVHTRVPIADPARISDELVAALKPERAGLWIGVHCNHPRELAPAARSALARLADAGFPLVSQTVLLAGINDDVETLCALMRALVSARVKPYYLHHPDLVRGTGHFRVSIARGQALMKALRGRLSGLAQPTYVLDVPGGHGKVPVGSSYLGGDADVLTVEDAFGKRHRYPA